jgi:catechol 2,3-dioxygenase-like lactoylglutathione lyase family enzyme
MIAAIEVVTLPVGDVDRALRFYTEQAGFTLDVDYQPRDDFRVVQLTPPGSPTPRPGLSPPCSWWPGTSMRRAPRW